MTTFMTYKEERDALRQQLAALQAVNQQYREALEHLSLYVAYNGDDWVQLRAKEALATQQDTSALEAMIAKAGEVMRERCFDSVQAEMGEQYIDSPHWYVAEARRDTISTLPGVTLEDLKGCA